MRRRLVEVRHSRATKPPTTPGARAAAGQACHRRRRMRHRRGSFLAREGSARSHVGIDPIAASRRFAGPWLPPPSGQHRRRRLRVGVSTAASMRGGRGGEFPGRGLRLQRVGRRRFVVAGRGAEVRRSAEVARKEAPRSWTCAWGFGERGRSSTSSTSAIITRTNLSSAAAAHTQEQQPWGGSRQVLWQLVATLLPSFIKNVPDAAPQTIFMLLAGLVVGSIFYDLGEDKMLERVLPIFLEELEILGKETGANAAVFLPLNLFLNMVFAGPVYWVATSPISAPHLAHPLLYTANPVVVCFAAAMTDFELANAAMWFFLFSGYSTGGPTCRGGGARLHAEEHDEPGGDG
ncbi:hypothetical protein BRADI_4g30723v3 [Brachypodium distachyon]|uniref:Uncharacterized protein n=1 Tax=Brachypodium distachyon TaxID=15368 RepID=A0A2K2CRH0_BRADI|nr:hypothetical protein BRADI_4g30723v3 [Brachypodium distachyon]